MDDIIQKPKKETFRFKQFSIDQESCNMKVGTDGVLLGAWADISSIESVLDIGTGSGLIALMMAQRSSAKLHAVEIEELAWKQAAKNFSNSPWKDRMTAHHIPIQDFSKLSRDTFDLVVSNPPFFSGGVFSRNQDRANVRHTIKLPNGDLLSSARSLMSDEGRFCVILPVIEGFRFKEMAKNYRLFCTKITHVLPFPGKDANRLLMQFEKKEKAMLEDKLVVWEQEGKYSKDFIDLTKSFYLDF